MATILENPFLQLVINPGFSSNGWSLNGGKDGASLLLDAQLGAVYRIQNRRVRATLPLDQAEIHEGETIQSPHGSLNLLQIGLGSQQDGLEYNLEFALPESKPLLLWRLRVKNNGQAPVLIDRLELFKGGRLELAAGGQVTSPDLAFLSNGWQSWSYSGVYGGQERQRRTRLWLLQEPPTTNPETPRTHRAGHFSSDMFAVLGERKSRTAVLAGFLSQRQHFGSLEAWANPSGFGLQMWANGDQARLDSGAETSTDWACLAMVDPDAADPLRVYTQAVAQEHNLKAHSHPSPTGWCSWYHFFQNIDPASIRHNLQAVHELHADLPLDLVQIDDGFETQVGDWLTFQPDFPEGVAPLAAEIRAAGLSPGLWLAPFIVHPRSNLRQEHPDWLLRGRLNRPVNAGFLWNTFTTALDLTHPDAQDYVREVIHTATQVWGFSYLKLDFLFAAALPGKRRDATRTRAQVLRAALEDVPRRCRSGDDTAGLRLPAWTCHRPGGCYAHQQRCRCRLAAVFPRHKGSSSRRSRTCRRCAMPCKMCCVAALHRRWWVNDPDCLLLRPETDLTLDELQSPGKRDRHERRIAFPVRPPAFPAAGATAHRPGPAATDRTGAAPSPIGWIATHRAGCAWTWRTAAANGICWL